jgi:hypothetical protein
MPTKKRRLPKGISLNPVAVVRPDPTPVKRYLFLVILIVMALSAAYLLIQGIGSPPPTQVPAPQIAEKQTAPPPQNLSILDRVKTHITVSNTETPRIWEITNVDLVKPQSPVLFKDAKTGDYVLVWSDRAAVYAPDTDKIVGMLMAATPNMQEAADTAATSTATSPATAALPTANSTTPARIEIRNASGIAGAAKRLKTDLGSIGLSVFKIGDTPIKRTGITIVDLSNGAQAQTITTLQGSINGTVVTALPEGEPASQADVLVIIGK